MKLTFCGAAHCVTGSCYLLEHGGTQVLIDCGLQQGRDEVDNRIFPFDPAQLEAVVVTHGHIDHCGRLPMLIRLGYTGSIHATGLTGELLEVVLRDSAEIQENDVAWRNQKGRRAGREAEAPLFTPEHVQQTLQRLHGHRYGERFTLCAGVECALVDAGHILGSAMVQLWWQEDGQEKTLVFSGDIGNHEMPIICDPTLLTTADYVVMESTCGDRLHPALTDYKEALAAILERTFAQNGNVLIPAAAVGRSQEVLYCLHAIKLEGLVPSFPDFPVYVDSHLAREMLAVYNGNLADYIDPAAMDIVRAAGTVLDFPGLRPLVSSEESRKLNQDRTPKVIIAAGSMCEAGRIRHHLKHNLWRSESAVVLLGAQRRGTLGQLLRDGAKHVKLLGEDIIVRATIEDLPVRSSHADQQALLDWISHFTPAPAQIFVTHGDADTVDQFVGLLQQKGLAAHGPQWLEQYDLDHNQQLSPGQSQQPSSSDYQELLTWGKRLQALLASFQHQDRKQIHQLCHQLKSLVQRWEK